jgi:hypothetical protein
MDRSGRTARGGVPPTDGPCGLPRVRSSRRARWAGTAAVVRPSCGEVPRRPGRGQRSRRDEGTRPGWAPVRLRVLRYAGRPVGSESVGAEGTMVPGAFWARDRWHPRRTSRTSSAIRLIRFRRSVTRNARIPSSITTEPVSAASARWKCSSEVVRPISGQFPASRFIRYGRRRRHNLRLPGLPGGTTRATGVGRPTRTVPRAPAATPAARAQRYGANGPVPHGEPFRRGERCLGRGSRSGPGSESWFRSC